MYHFYTDAESIGDKTISITGDDYSHIKNVLRMRIGEEVVVGDGKGAEYGCRICEYSDGQVLLDILERSVSEAELPVKLCLFQGLPKKDKMELIIQKAVELGVYEIVPVMMKRTIVKLEDAKKEEKKRERWQSIAEAAAKQSGRGIIPNVSEVVSFEKALQKADELSYNILPYENAEGMQAARECIKTITSKDSAGIFIGPEGGFDSSEIDKATAHNIVPISLGKRILRTETAGLCILSVIMFETER